MIAAIAVLALLVIYSISTNKQPSEEFESLTENSDSTQGQASQASAPPGSQGSGAGSSSGAISASPGAEGSFGLNITSPWQGETLVRGAKHTITWEGIFTDRVRITLRRQGSSLNMLVVENRFASTQNHEWAVPTSLAVANDYYFMIVPQIQSYTRAATSPLFRVTDEQVVSATKSVVEASPTSVSAEPNCFANVSVRALNQYELPVVGKKVSLTTERPGTAVLATNDTTNSNGAALFRTGSQTQGTAIFVATIDGVRVNDTAVVSFLNPPPFCNTR